MISLGIRRAFVLAACALAAAGCRRTEVPEAAAALQVVLSEKPIVLLGNTVASGDSHDAAVWADVQDFYTRRQGAPAWIIHRSTSPRSTAALAVLQSAPTHGLNPADYGAPQIATLLETLDHSSKDAPDRLRQLAEADVRLTTALFALGRDVALGRTTPERVDSRWKARRTAPDFVGTLALASEADLSFWLDTIRPTQPDYALLQTALAGLRQTQASQPGATAAAFYDTRTAVGIRAFQEHHGIKATGVADKATLSAISVPVEERIRQIELNLERWRWMPNDFGTRYLIVNIPLYQVAMRENGVTVDSIRVVVGQRDHETPVFSGEMDTIVFSPYWNIPDSIVTGETAPAAAKNSEYLAKHHIEILRVTSTGATTVRPSDVNWSDPKELNQLAFRQQPGPDNALGHVKFLFPNKYDVYLHDSPADELFARPGRALSHGCVRVEEPETLAQYVMRGDSDWPLEKMQAAMNSGVEKHVKIKQPLPVHIVYFTAFVDKNGGLHFVPDVYGYDRKQAGLASPKPGGR